MIRWLAPQFGLDCDTAIKQCQAESSMNQEAKSGCGARGLMQLMPDTAKELGVDPTRWQDNIHGGLKYMKRLKAQFGSIDKALAAYNWGPGHLSKLLSEHPGDWRAHLPLETQNYLTKIIG
jgi:soluble lytic murein transglycosylase-like protein